MKHAATIFIALYLSLFSHADTISLKDGTEIHGRLLETKANFLLIQLPEDEGEATRRVSPQKTLSISFSDQSSELEGQAILRAKFLPYLSEPDSAKLIEYLDALLSKNQALSALSYAKIWHPKNKYTSLDSKYRELLIKSSLKANLPSEALVHAQNWLSLNPQPFEQALPWALQAQHHFNTGRFQEALWTCLTPIAHAKDYKEHEALHEIAAKTYQKLGYTDHATAHRSPSKLPTPSIPLFLDPQKRNPQFP